MSAKIPALWVSNTEFEICLQKMLKSGLENREDEEQALRHQAASLRVKMDALNEDMRKLTGRIEEIKYLLNQFFLMLCSLNIMFNCIK